jgi:hypothetical protein
MKRILMTIRVNDTTGNIIADDDDEIHKVTKLVLGDEALKGENLIL